MNNFVCQHFTGLPTKTCIVCQSSSPESLVDLCLNFINTHLEVICDCKSFKENLNLKTDTTLPINLCNYLLNIRLNNLSEINSKFIKIFKNKECTKLNKVNIYGTDNIKETDFKILLKHRLNEVNISYNSSISSKGIKYINENSENLISLHIGEITQIIPDDKHRSNVFIEKYTNQDCIFIAPSLKHLSINSLHFYNKIFYSRLLRPMTTLTHLDLSDCHNLGKFEYSNHLIKLSSLILHNTSELENIIDSICKLKTLKHLDISTSIYEYGQYKNADQLLTILVKNLTGLTSLDISGTNLTGDNENGNAGLNLRKNNPFRYLGLYKTTHNACLRTDIPAKLIAGNANEDQLLIASKTFIKRTDMFTKILSDILDLLRNKICTYIGQFLSVVLEAMNIHLINKDIQILGSNILLHILKRNNKEAVNLINVKRKIITTLFNSMRAFIKEELVIQNGCSILCKFNIPSDVLFDYDTFIKILLKCIDKRNKNLTQKKAIYLLNCVASEVSGNYKLKLGQLGVVNAVTDLIEMKLNQGYCDEVLETAWLALWNMTDETPLNCEIFLKENGMKLFNFCIDEYSNEDEMLSNMMGVLSNIAEIPECRRYLINEKYLTIFENLLDFKSKAIEISYNTAAVILHLASDGPEVWHVSNPSRKELLNKVSLTIDKWDMASTQDVNYTSFKPFFNLINIHQTPECQKWAAWALASLTTVNSEKHSPMIEAENGFEMLEALMENPSSSNVVKNWISLALQNCSSHKKRRLN